jgi:hypothetical protein
MALASLLPGLSQIESDLRHAKVAASELGALAGATE